MRLATICRLLALCFLLGHSSVILAHGKKEHAEATAPTPESAASEMGSGGGQSAPAPAPAAPELKPPSDEAVQEPKPGGSKREPDSHQEDRPTSAPNQTKAHPASEVPRDASAELSIDALIRDLSFAEFPTLHPMVVHVPVTFIPLGFVFALISLLVAHRALIGLAFAFALGGLGGGLVAAFPMHPHTTDLSAAAKVTLEKHDFFAYGTLWLALVAVLVGVFCLWKPGRLPKLLLSLVLLLSSLSVSITGHYGGTLAYIHGVGVQGRYLSSH